MMVTAADSLMCHTREVGIRRERGIQDWRANTGSSKVKFRIPGQSAERSSASAFLWNLTGSPYTTFIVSSNLRASISHRLVQKFPLIATPKFGLLREKVLFTEVVVKTFNDSGSGIGPPSVSCPYDARFRLMPKSSATAVEIAVVDFVDKRVVCWTW